MIRLNRGIRLAGVASLAALAAVMAGANGTTIQNDKQKIDTTKLAPYSGPKKRIAVMPMSINSQAQSGFQEYIRAAKAEQNIHSVDDVGTHLTEMLTTALINSGRFVVLERAAIQDIKDEMAVGAELGNDKTAVKKGNVLGAQILVRAAVTEFAPHRKSGGSGISLGGIRIGGSQDEAEVGLDVRFFDPNTSEVIDSVTTRGDSKSEGASVGFWVGSLGVGAGGGNQQPIEKATRDAVTRAVIAICNRMAQVPWEAKVAKVSDDGTIVLNRGTNDGLKVGDKLQVFKPGETITDPDTGKVLGRDKDVFLGDATISWVSENLCRCTFLGTGKPETGAVVRFVDAQG